MPLNKKPKTNDQGVCVCVCVCVCDICSEVLIFILSPEEKGNEFCSKFTMSSIHPEKLEKALGLLVNSLFIGF